MTFGVAFESVLAAAQAGAPWAWQRLYAELSPHLLGFLRAQAVSDPEDALGDVWVDVARNIARFDGDEAKFRSWLFSIAYHRIVDDRRRRARRPLAATPVVEVDGRQADAADAPDAVADRREREQNALALLDVLTVDQRDVLVLRLFGDLSLDEVAALTRRDVGAVKALQHRGVAALRRHVQKFPNDPYLQALLQR